MQEQDCLNLINTKLIRTAFAGQGPIAAPPLTTKEVDKSCIELHDPVIIDSQDAHEFSAFTGAINHPTLVCLVDFLSFLR